MPKACPNCGIVNRDTARFCQNCRQPFPQSVSCPVCHALNVDSARFCQQCGAALTPGTAPVRGTGLLAPSSLLAKRYLILTRIGQGGMGAVYKATDTRLGNKVVAVKELSEASLASDTDRLQARQAFEREATLLGQLSHPNLPRVSDHFMEDGRQYLVMDFIDGQTLADVIEATAGPLDVKRVTGWAEQLCDVLGYLHGQQPPIIFRDLKPGNIMVERSGKIKLIDFGIARLFKAGKASDTTSFGTVGYAPPEQYGKGQTDARSDIYALGATLHHLLTGVDPGDAPFSFRPVRSLNRGVPEALAAAVMKAVEQEPGQRFQNVRQMRAALTALAAPPAPPARVAPPKTAPVVAPTRAAAAPPQPYVAAPPARQAPAPAPVAPPRVPAPTPAMPVNYSAGTGGCVTLIIAGALAALSWMALDLLGGYGLASILLIQTAVTWIWEPLAYMLTRRPIAALLTNAFGLAGAFILSAGAELDAWSLLPGGVLLILFALRGSRRPTFWAMALSPMIAQAINLWAIDYRMGSQLYLSPDMWVSLLGGAFLGGAAAFVIGRVLGR